MILVNKSNKMLIAVVETAEKDINGVYVDRDILDGNGNKKDLIYADIDNEIDVIDVEVPTNVEPVKFCYDQTTGFYANPDYVEVIPPEVEIKNLKDQISLMQQALDDLLLGGM